MCAANRANSSGRPSRRVGELRNQRASASVTLSSVPTMPVSIGVSNPPATIELTRIPVPARSREAGSDSPMIPALPRLVTGLRRRPERAY